MATLRTNEELAAKCYELADELRGERTKRRHYQRIVESFRSVERLPASQAMKALVVARADLDEARALVDDLAAKLAGLTAQSDFSTGT